MGERVATVVPRTPAKPEDLEEVREILLKLWNFPVCFPTLSHKLCTGTLSEKMNERFVRS